MNDRTELPDIEDRFLDLSPSALNEVKKGSVIKLALAVLAEAALLARVDDLLLPLLALRGHRLGIGVHLPTLGCLAAQCSSLGALALAPRLFFAHASWVSRWRVG